MFIKNYSSLIAHLVMCESENIQTKRSRDQKFIFWYNDDKDFIFRIQHVKIHKIDSIQIIGSRLLSDLTLDELLKHFFAICINFY